MPDPKPAAPITPERIMRWSFGYAPPLILEAAVRHGVFDSLDAGAKTVADVQRTTGASARGLRMIMDALVGLELLTKGANGDYALSPDSAAFLVSGKPGFRGGMFKHTSRQLLPRWLELNEIVRTGRPAAAVNQQTGGAEFFQEFVEDIFPMSYDSARKLGEALGVPRASKPISVLDLAAGSGVWGIALAEQSPNVRVTAVDWAGVLPVTQRVAARRGVADRFRFVAGDLLEADYGSGHHIATLGHIVHSEGEARSKALFARTFAALAPGGTIAIAEWLVNDQRTEPLPSLIFAVNMLVNTDAGDCYSFNELRGWLDAAGFRNARTVETHGPSPLVLADKPA